MVSIIISACLAAHPDVCKDHRVPLNENWDATRCYLYAAPFFAKWSEEHPGWEIKSWKCSSNDVQNL